MWSWRRITRNFTSMALHAFMAWNLDTMKKWYLPKFSTPHWSNTVSTSMWMLQGLKIGSKWPWLAAKSTSTGSEWMSKPITVTHVRRTFCSKSNLPHKLANGGAVPLQAIPIWCVNNNLVCVQTGSGAHPASYTVGTGSSFPVGKARPGRDADHSPPSSAEVKKE
jgi:hypothetical protein